MGIIHKGLSGNMSFDLRRISFFWDCMSGTYIQGSSTDCTVLYQKYHIEYNSTEMYCTAQKLPTHIEDLRKRLKNRIDGVSEPPSIL